MRRSITCEKGARQAASAWRAKGARQAGAAWAAIALAIACVLAFALACAMPAQRAYADELGKSFMVAAAQQDGTYVLEPTSVAYELGDSVQEALERADIGFEFTQSGTVDSIAGVKPQAGVYLYYFTDYEKRESVMLDDVSADSIRALFVSSADVDGIAAGHADLLDCMRTFALRTDGLRNYPDAITANERAFDSLPSATNAQATAIAADFAQAIAAYDAYLGMPKSAVTFSVTRGGTSVGDAQVTMTDVYGNVTKAARTGVGTYTAQVVPGTYSYEALSANGLDGVRCTSLKVAAAMQVAAELPADEWFGQVTLRVKSDGYADCPTNGTSAAQRANEPVQNVVPDAVLAEADLSVYAVPAQVIASDKAAYPLYAVYAGADGEDHDEQIAYASRSYMPPYLVEPGTAGTQYAYEVRHHVDSSLTTYQVEICNATIVRSPTLAALSVREDAAEVLSGFSPYTKEYSVYTSADELAFGPAPRGAVAEGYAVQVAGKSADSGPVTVDIGDEARTAPVKVPVVVRLTGADGNAYTREYAVNVTKEDPSTVTIQHDADVTVQVVGEAGGTVAPIAGTATSTTFKLLAAHVYTYVATKDEHFHATLPFTALDGTTVQAATPATADAVASFSLGQDNLWGSVSSAKPLFPLMEGSTAHDQRFLVPDYWSGQSWLRAYAADSDKAQAYTFRSAHERQDTGVQVTSSSSAFKPTWDTVKLDGKDVREQRISGSLPGFTTQSGYPNTATFTVTTGLDAQTGAAFTQDYRITAVRDLTLPGLSASDGKNTLKLATADTADLDNPTYGFDRNVRDYVVSVAEGTKSLQVGFTFPRPISDKALAAGGYTVVIDGQETPYAEGATVTQQVALDPEQHVQTIAVVVRHDDAATPDASYRLQVRLMPKVSVAFDVTPADASVTVTDPATGLRVNANDDGSFDLITGYEYGYSVAARGYVGQQGSFVAHDGLETSIVLAPAPENPTIDTGLASHWPYFRADANNNGVVDARTPIPGAGKGADATTADDPLLYWATQVGEGFDSAAAGCPILVDGYLYTYAGDKIYKMDTVTGEIVAAGTMVGTSSFAITPMTYAEGMVFVALSNGRVEAFNAATLESLWVYTSPNGGQPNCPIAYHDGCIYTGFWNWANVCDFVCLTVTDEDPTTPGSATVDDPDHPGRTKSAVLDAKVALWTMQHEGGFYWAGAWAGDDYVLVGSDNARITAGLDTNKEADASGTLYSLDPLTGQVLDTLTGYQGASNIGNIRSTVMRDAATGTFYFCGRAGYLCSVNVNADGTFDKASARAIKLRNGASDGMVSATSTPVVYNGRAYVGADHGAYNAYDGQCIDVVDLASGSVAYTVQMQGRAQASGLLTTGYVDDDGYVYLYYFDNYHPGKLRCFKDKKGQKAPIDVSTETAGGKEYANMANVVFCPQGAQAQWCICSPIADEYGTIYFKNDSAYMMALGSPVEKLEVVQQPTVTQYGVGETFEPAGMKVVATYANGATRDVTDYVEVSDEPFEAEGAVDVPVVFPYTMYQSGPSAQDIGQAPDYNYEKPTTTVSVTVGSAVAPRLTLAELPHAQAPDVLAGKDFPYEVTLTATGAPRDFTWTCEGDLPAGLTFASNAEDGTAAISGTPGAGTGGAYPIKVTCANSVGTAESQLTLEVYEIPRITAPGLLSGVTGQQFSYQVQASGYPQPLVYALQDGFTSAAGWTSHAPAGLSIDADTGLISGEPQEPMDPATQRMRVYASNEAGISVPVNLRVSITGESLVPPAGAPEITTAALGHALPEAETGYVVAGEQVSLPIEATGDPTPAGGMITVEGLPDGLTYDAATTSIVGAASAVDEEGAAVKVTADNGVGAPDVRTYTLYVYAAPSTDVEAWAGAVFGEAYEQQLGIAGAPSPNVVVTGLASGLHYDKATGTVYGTPKMKGAFKVSVTASNAAGSFTKTYQLVVGAAPAIGTYALPDAREGSAYTVPLKVSGEPAPTVTVEGLPAGLSYNADAGMIAGTPTACGTFEVSVAADNGAGAAMRTLTLVVAEDFALATAEIPHVIATEAYEATLSFTKPLAGADVAGLPAGLTATCDEAAGTVTIAAKADAVEDALAGDYELAIAATSARGTALSATLPLVVEPYAKAVSLAPSADLFPWETGASISVDLAEELHAYGRPATFEWKVADGSGLPAGLALDAGTGVLSGTPAAAGAYAFQVVCDNGVGAASALVKLQVYGAPEFGELAVPEGLVGANYSASVAAAVGLPQPMYTWVAAAGSALPPGLQLDSATGAITGTCGQRGIYTVAVTADNGKGQPAVAQVTIVVKQSIADARFDAIPAVTYDGAAHEPTFGVYSPAQGGSGAGGGLAAGSFQEALEEGVDYTVAFEDNVNAGTGRAVVAGAGLFTGTTVRKFTINKAAQSFSAKATKKSFKVKLKKVLKKKQTTAATVKVAGARGAVTYSKVKVSKKKLAKKFTVNPRTGKITVAKKTKKGTYRVTVGVTAAGDGNYLPATANVVVKVVVK